MQFTPGKHLTESQKDPQSGLIKAWSFSGLKKFENCPQRSFIQSVLKVKEPQSDAANRGEQIHDAIEKYIKGDEPVLPATVAKHPELVDLIDKAKDAFFAGNAAVEQNWGFDKNWQPTGFFDDDVWNRTKIDCLIRDSETSAKIYDWKTGKKFGNEVKHNEQNMFYAMAAFMKYPKLEFVEAAMVYVDEGKLGKPMQYTREQFMTMYFPRLQKRALEMTTATKFVPRPSKHNCRFCPYKEMTDSNTGKILCEFGVLDE